MHMVAHMRSQGRRLGIALVTLENQDWVMATRWMEGYWVRATTCLPEFLQRL